MKKETFTTADFQRKPYAKPRIKVVEIEGADIICTSGASTQSLEEDEFDWNNSPIKQTYETDNKDRACHDGRRNGSGCMQRGCHRRE